MKTVFILFASFITLVSYSQDTLSWLVPYKEGKLWGLADTNGKVIVTPKFEYVDFAFQNRARFKEKGLYGYLDEKGTIVIPAKYKEASPFGYIRIDDKNLAEVKDANSGPYFIDLSGKKAVGEETFPPPVEELLPISKGLSITALNQKYKKEYDSIVSANEPDGYPFGYYKVYKNGKVGLMDPAQNVKLAADYQSLDVYGVQFIVVKFENSYRIIDDNNNWQYPNVLDSIIYIPSSRYVHIKENGKWGALSNQLKPVIKPQYDAIYSSMNSAQHPVFSDRSFGASNFTHNIFIVEKNGRQGIYNDRYGYTIQPQFKNILHYANYQPYSLYNPSHSIELIYVQTDDGKEGFTDRSGKKRFFK
jgi:hypothetical protein